jgi:hypothetical protein
MQQRNVQYALQLRNAFADIGGRSAQFIGGTDETAFSNDHAKKTQIF